MRAKQEKKPKVIKKPTRLLEGARADAAAEVLEAVWLHEDHFELDYKIDNPPVVEEDKQGYAWVTVKIHVPALDIDCWIDGSHHAHPDNQPDGDA